MEDDHFTGSFETLFEYWQDEDRATKFESGGTRTNAVQYLLNRAEVEIHKGLWIDSAIGAGFAQSQLFQSVLPSLLVGIDISRNMLAKVQEPVERILGSAFQLPVRSEVATLSTNIFCLSDYPDPSQAMNELARVTKRAGVLMYLDYSTNDQYWLTRKAAHDDNRIIGNINLRDPETIRKYLPDTMREVANIEIIYDVDTDNFDNRLELPPSIKRAFLFVEMYKPRSS